MENSKHFMTGNIDQEYKKLAGRLNRFIFIMNCIELYIYTN